MNVAKVILAGNLTRDPELRYTQSGMAICEISVAVNEKRKDNKEKVNFHEVKSFGNTAEAINKFFSKGARIYIEGRLDQERWQDKDTGANRSKTTVIADSFQFVDRRSDNGDQQYQQSQNYPSEHSQQKANGYQPQRYDKQDNPPPPMTQGNNQTQPDNEDEDIPF